MGTSLRRGVLGGPTEARFAKKVGGEVKKFIEHEYTEVVVLGDITGLEYRDKSNIEEHLTRKLPATPGMGLEGIVNSSEYTLGLGGLISSLVGLF